jgi:chemotaxis receptor (MCP) glutamine deamidase CheD
MIYFGDNNDNNPPHYHVAVAEAYFTENKSLKCILGSCVSIILFSQNQLCTYSSMSHYLLDKPAETGNIDGDGDKFGSILIPKQVEEMLKSIERKDLQAMIFGGSTGNGNLKAEIIANIGARNVKIAEEKMAEYNIKVIAQNTGMQCSRFVDFNPIRKNAILKITTDSGTKFYSFKS